MINSGPYSKFKEKSKPFRPNIVLNNLIAISSSEDLKNINDKLKYKNVITIEINVGIL